MDDWECDIGFTRQQGECISKKAISYKEPEVCKNTYEVSLGYIKV